MHKRKQILENFPTVLRLMRIVYDFNFRLELSVKTEVLILKCPVETYAPKLNYKSAKKFFLKHRVKTLIF
jgi:hypothetical protein